jgi:MFS family permease
LVGFTGFGPSFVLALPSGALADRVSRRLIIAITHVVGLVTTAALAAATFAGRLTPSLLLAISLVVGTAYAVAKPAMQALMPSLVPRSQLRQAVAANTSQFMVAQLVGPMMAGLLVAVFGLGWAFLANSLSFVGMVVVMVGLGRSRSATAETPMAVDADRRLPAPVRDRRRGSPISIAASPPLSLRSYLASNRHLGRLLVVVATSNWIIEGMRTVATVIVVVALDAGEKAGGWVISAYGLGAVLAIVTLGGSIARRPPLVSAAAGFGCIAAGMFALGAAPALPWALAAASVAGIGHFLASTTSTGLIQEGVDDAMRGRVMSVHSMATLGIRPFAAVAMGAAASQSVRLATSAWGLFSLVGLFSLSRLAVPPDRWRRWTPLAEEEVAAPPVEAADAIADSAHATAVDDPAAPANHTPVSIAAAAAHEMSGATPRRLEKGQ